MPSSCHDDFRAQDSLSNGRLACCRRMFQALPVQASPQGEFLFAVAQAVSTCDFSIAESKCIRQGYESFDFAQFASIQAL